MITWSARHFPLACWGLLSCGLWNHGSSYHPLTQRARAYQHHLNRQTTCFFVVGVALNWIMKQGAALVDLITHSHSLMQMRQHKAVRHAGVRHSTSSCVPNYQPFTWLLCNNSDHSGCRRAAKRPEGDIRFVRVDIEQIRGRWPFYLWKAEPPPGL